jgi:hypothetical protein
MAIVEGKFNQNNVSDCTIVLRIDLDLYAGCGQILYRHQTTPDMPAVNKADKRAG